MGEADVTQKARKIKAQKKSGHIQKAEVTNPPKRVTRFGWLHDPGNLILDNSPEASIPVGLATKGLRPAGVKVVMDGVILKLETGLSGEIEDGVVFLDNPTTVPLAVTPIRCPALVEGPVKRRMLGPFPQRPLPSVLEPSLAAAFHSPPHGHHFCCIQVLSETKSLELYMNLSTEYLKI